MNEDIEKAKDLIHNKGNSDSLLKAIALILVDIAESLDVIKDRTGYS